MMARPSTMAMRMPSATSRRMVSNLPFRIRAPLAKLVERNAAAPAASFRPAALGDGEALEGDKSFLMVEAQPCFI